MLFILPILMNFFLNTASRHNKMNQGSTSFCSIQSQYNRSVELEGDSTDMQPVVLSISCESSKIYITAN